MKAKHFVIAMKNAMHAGNYAEVYADIYEAYKEAPINSENREILKELKQKLSRRINLACRHEDEVPAEPDEGLPRYSQLFDRLEGEV